MDKRSDLGEASWYELLASLLYIIKNRQSWGIASDDAAIFDALIKQKPQYNVPQCTDAFATLHKYGFI